MEGQTNRNDSFAETFDSHQGSPNEYVDHLASLGDRLSPIESRLSNHVVALHDGSVRPPSNRAQTSRGWDHGEASSSGNNVQEQTSEDDSKMKFAWYSTSGASSATDSGPEPEYGPPELSTTISTTYDENQVTDRSQNIQNYSSASLPVNFRPNQRQLRENNCNSDLEGGRPNTLYESGRVGTEEILVRYASSSNLGASSCSSSTSVENNDASAPSFGTWGSSCKRKALEGSSGHFYPGGSSNSSQPMENIVQHSVPGRCTSSRNLSISSSESSADDMEQLNSRSGVGIGRVGSGRFTSSRLNGITQNLVRNFPSRSSPGHLEPVPFDASRGPSSLYASQPQSQSPMPPPLNLNNTVNEPSVNVNESGRTHLPPRHESFSSRRGSSSYPFSSAAERGYRGHEDVNFRRLIRSFPEYPTVVPDSDTTNIFGDQIDWSFTPGNSLSARNYADSLINPSSGGRSSPSAWSTPRNQTSQDRLRLLEDAHWISSSSVGSESRSQRGPFAPLHLPSASSDERASSSQAQHQSDRRSSSFLMDPRGDNTNGRNVLAAVEGRNRLIRQVLSAMRRGAHLRDEDYMLIDPSVNGFAELHDQHLDMRLDVDNMSYEELLALEEQIGDVNTGLSEEKIRGSMKKRKYESVKALQAMEPCCICREDYVAGDDIGILDCGHEFHTDCIKQWLILKNICPICKNAALET